jgi:AcrR family transcriptional regulator
VPSDPSAPELTWVERAAERSPLVQRSRSRSLEQTRTIVDAARRLIDQQGEFTAQELVKEAGVALQTFYRYFGGKDQLLVAVLEDMIGQQAAALEQQAAGTSDPIARLHFYVTAPLQLLGDDDTRLAARSVTAEHWRLHQLFPDDIANASRPFVDLIRRTLLDAQAEGLLDPTDAARDAWLVVELVRSVYHYYAFAELDRTLDDIAEHVWTFCLRSVGGQATT